MVTVTTVVVRCSQLTTDVWILCIFQGNAEHLKEPFLHTDFFPILLMRNDANKNPKSFCVSSRRHQLVARSKRVRSPTPRSCARAVPHPAASRGQQRGDPLALSPTGNGTSRRAVEQLIFSSKKQVMLLQLNPFRKVKEESLGEVRQWGTNVRGQSSLCWGKHQEGNPGKRHLEEDLLTWGTSEGKNGYKSVRTCFCSGLRKRVLLGSVES